MLDLKIFVLKSFKRHKYAKYANVLTKKVTYGQRGDIYSLNGKIISTTAMTYDVYWDSHTDYIQRHPELIEKNLYILADSLSNLLEKPMEQIFQYLKNKYEKGERYIPIAKRLELSETARLKNFPIFKLPSVRGGLVLEPRRQRIHPYNYLAFKTIGSFHANNTGSNTGIERAYNSQLTGQPGVVIYRKGPRGSQITEKILIHPENGCDVVSTLDMNIQYYLETALNQRLHQLNADHGIGIVMDVKTGEIRAMANLTLNPQDSLYYESVNNAVRWFYEPGSVMKPFSMIALFEDYNIPLNAKVNTGNGIFKVADHQFHDDKKGGYGLLTVQGIVEHSSNVGVVKVILQYFSSHPEKFINRLREIGVDKKTGIDLDGEISQPLKDPNSKEWWGDVSLGQIAIGYEHRMTPLQILSLYNAIANNGYFITPHLVRNFVCNGIKKPNTNIKIEKRSIASPNAIKKVQQMLKGVVIRGTASHHVRSDIVPIAGKTGTAQIYKKNKGYTTQYNTTFVGYFPADNPRYSMIVVISNPKKEKSGALAAGPVFKQVAEKICLYERCLNTQKELVVNYWPKNFQTPQVKNGFRTPIIYLINYFNISYSDNSSKSVFIKVFSKPDYLLLEPFNIKPQNIYKTLTLSAIDASFIYSYAGYNVRMEGVGKITSEKRLDNKTVKLYLK